MRAQDNIQYNKGDHTDVLTHSKHTETDEQTGVRTDDHTDLCALVDTWHNMLTDQGMSQQSIASEFKTNRSRVCKLLKVRELPEDVRAYIAAHNPTERSVIGITQGGYADSESMIAALKRSGSSRTVSTTKNPRDKQKSAKEPTPRKQPLLDAAVKQHIDNSLNELKSDILQKIDELKPQEIDFSNIHNQIEAHQSKQEQATAQQTKAIEGVKIQIDAQESKSEQASLAQSEALQNITNQLEALNSRLHALEDNQTKQEESSLQQATILKDTAHSLTKLNERLEKVEKTHADKLKVQKSIKQKQDYMQSLKNNTQSCVSFFINFLFGCVWLAGAGALAYGMYEIAVPLWEAIGLDKSENYAIISVSIGLVIPLLSLKYSKKITLAIATLFLIVSGSLLVIGTINESESKNIGFSETKVSMLEKKIAHNKSKLEYYENRYNNSKNPKDHLNKDIFEKITMFENKILSLDNQLSPMKISTVKNGQWSTGLRAASRILIEAVMMLLAHAAVSCWTKKRREIHA